MDDSDPLERTECPAPAARGAATASSALTITTPNTPRTIEVSLARSALELDASGRGTHARLRWGRLRGELVLDM